MKVILELFVQLILGKDLMGSLFLVFEHPPARQCLLHEILENYCFDIRSFIIGHFGLDQLDVHWIGLDALATGDDMLLFDAAAALRISLDRLLLS